MNLQAAAAGSVGSLLTVSLLSSTPIVAQFDGDEERMRPQFIESDIHHCAPTQAIYMIASASASSADDFSFKAWASSISRYYCSRGYDNRDRR